MGIGLLAGFAAQAQSITIPGPAGSGQFGASVTVLPNGNFVVTDPEYDLGGIANVGAVYLYRGTDNTLISTLTGSTAGDRVGSSVVMLTNGNYVVRSIFWANGPVSSAGAITWGNGSTGTTGVVSPANSLVGSTTHDNVGNGISVVALTNGNYVVSSPTWDNGSAADAGAVTWGNGSTGTTGVVSPANSLVGTTSSDQVGNGGVVELTNGNYVVSTFSWDNGSVANVGAITWGNGSTGTTGVVSPANSLVGSTTNDNVGNGTSVVALTNGNYVVCSPAWNNGSSVDAGAVTWGNGSTGTTGVVSPANSLVGTTSFDNVGNFGVVALTNGHYVVNSTLWSNGAVLGVGAVTWGNGSTGISGAVSTANSLVGSVSNDRVGDGGVVALTNGHYVVSSLEWDNGSVVNAGAVTWVNGSAGTSAVVSTANSLVGSSANDNVGGVVALTNGNYVCSSIFWDNGSVVNAGAVTWGNGSTGTVGVVSAANSLVGSTSNDRVGNGTSGVVALTNGHYVFSSVEWDNGSVVNAGAITWGNGTGSTVGVINAANSLVGTASFDLVGSGGVVALANGNYVGTSHVWSSGTATNAGAVTWGNGSTGTTGVVSPANSLVGTTSSDQVGNGGVVALPNGHYVVRSFYWANGSVTLAGALTLGLGNGSTVGEITACNSIIASVTDGGRFMAYAYHPPTSKLLGGVRVENKVVVGIGTPPAPTGTASQSFAPGTTVAALVATGTAIQWYATPSGGAPLASATPLTNGATYYATQTLNGCESIIRLPVVVTLTLPDLVVSTGSLLMPTAMPAGTYNNVTVTGTGVGQLSGTLVVQGAFVVQDGGWLDTNCQPITGSGSFTLAAGATLTICDPNGLRLTGNSGQVRVTGTRSYAADASYYYNGTTRQETGSGLPAQVRNLSTGNAQTLTLTLPVAVVRTLTIAGAGNLDLAGLPLTLLSTASGTALAVNSGSGVVTGGTATVQRYLSPDVNPGLGYRHLSAPVTGSTVTDLTTAGFAPVVNPAYNVAPDPGLVTPFPTVYGYEQTRLASAINSLSAFDKGWVSPAALTAALEAGRGYTVNLTGGETVDFTGTLNTGDLTLNLARNSGPTAVDAGWQLVGNPYPAPVDWRLVLPTDRTGLDGSLYVYESSSRYGGSYRAYINGLGGNPLIGSSQGFFVRVSPGQTSGTLTFRNSQRLTDYADQAPVRRSSADQRPQLQLRLRGQGLQDDLYLYAEAGATSGADAAFDAVKLPNTTGLNLAAVAATGQELAIQGLADFASATVVPLTLQLPQAGTYRFQALSLLNLPTTAQLVLVDHLTGTRTDLRTLPATGYAFTSATTAVIGRFYLNLLPAAPLASAPQTLSAQVLVYPVPAKSQVTVLRPAGEATTAILLNSLGQQVRTLSLPAAATTVDLHGLASGVYTLRLFIDHHSVNKRVVIE